MELKKNPKVDLEKSKSIFLQIGMILSLGIVFLAFEWTTSAGINTEFVTVQEGAVEEELVPITQPEEVKPPPPPPQPVQVVDVIKIVEDDVELQDDVDLFVNEFSEKLQVNINPFKEEEVEVVEEEIFVIVEDMPTFQGGDLNKFREYVNKNLKYPEIAAENGIQGRVILSFVVEPTGNVSKVTILKGVDPALDKEAIRVVETSPKWKAGSQRGKPVRVSFNIPIIFQLQ